MPVENDIFISYSHLDDKPPKKGEEGWVTTFHRALEVRVGQLLGRKPRIFRDLKLDRAKLFPEELEQRLSTTTLLVCILSPGYVESAWCRRELTAFLRHESAVEAGRVFKVAKTHLKIDEHPEALQEVLGHDFFVKDDEVVRDLDQTFSTKELQDKYWVMLDDLARAITRRLKELKTSTNEPRLPEPSSMANRLEIELKIKRPFDQFSKENQEKLKKAITDLCQIEAIEQVVVTKRLRGSVRLRLELPADYAEEVVKAARAGEFEKDHGVVEARFTHVYLAVTSFDLEEDRDAIKRELELHGYTVLPDRQLPYVAAEFEAIVREQLARCRFSIHLVGKSYGIIPDSAQESVVVLQNKLALARNAKAFSRLIWIPPDLKVEDARQEQFIEHLRIDERTHQDADLFEMSLEDFKTAIHNKLKPPPPPRHESQRSEETDLARIYLIRDQQDADAILPLEQYLWDQPNVEVLPSVFDGDEAEVREYHEESLRDCNAALIYYGQGNVLWLQTKLRELRKSAGYRARPMQVKVVLVAPPPNQQKQHFRTREALVIHQGDGFEPEALAPFLVQFQAVSCAIKARP